MSNIATIILDIFILIFVSIGILTSVGILYSIYCNRDQVSVDTSIFLQVGIYPIYYSYLLQLCFRLFEVFFININDFKIFLKCFD